MPECTNQIDCCLPSNFSYEIAPAEGVYLTINSVPSDGGSTTGGGVYQIGDTATVTETPAVPASIDVAVDMVFVVDESGSMADARAILADVTENLEAELVAAGIGSASLENRYACVAFGTGDPAELELDFQDGASFAAAAATIGISGSGTLCEDAYEGIDFAINSADWRPAGPVSRVIFFITDEDRQSTDAGPPNSFLHIYDDGAGQDEQFLSLKEELLAGGYILAGMFNTSTNQLRDSDGNVMIASDWTGKCYAADGAGGYTEHTGAVNDTAGTYSINDSPGSPVVSDTNPFPTGQNEEYYDLVTDGDIQGYFFSLNQYRTNATTADSVLATIVPSLADRITQDLTWTFTGWYTQGGELLSTDSSYSFTMLGNTVLEARFEHD